MGRKNKIPANLKEDLVAVYEEMGGFKGMLAWASRNDRGREKFYGWLVALLPKQVAVSGTVSHEQAKELINIIKEAGVSMRGIDLEEK